MPCTSSCRLRGGSILTIGLALEDWQAIGQVCRTLRGMPVGIELAVVWIRQFSAQQIAEEIGRGLDFLTTNMRNAPERQRSLRAAFDYSWRLLTPDVQAVFARLATFHGSFDLAAATTIAGAVLDQLALLTEKSLLQQDNDRYEMHPLLSRFAAEKLDADPAARQAAHGRHAAFYLAFITGHGRGAAQRRAIETELPNIRAALAVGGAAAVHVAA